MSSSVKVKVVVLDIEGTVCPISFVKETLFPYALQAITDNLQTKWDDPEFAQYRDAFPPEATKSQAAFREHVKDLMHRDVKAPYLKSLQGYLWENGYKSGELKAPLFADVPAMFTFWIGHGQRIMIYSSGSVPAQKLLFKHTNADTADLTPAITDFFDTINAGPKTEASSYEKIASKYPSYKPAEFLFLSDNVNEVEAATKAGMQGIVVQREGNHPLPEDVEKHHKVIPDFNELN